MRLLPPGAGRDAGVLLETRGIRAFGDGVVSVVLAAYLAALGLSDVRIGTIVTATLLGSAALTLGVGLRAHAVNRRRLLSLVSLLMIATGLGFAAATSFWPLLVVAFVGTLNPSGGDVSVFLPTEQALLPGTAPDASAPRCSPATASSGRSSPPSARSAPACRSGWATAPAWRRRPRCAGRSSATPRLGVLVLARYRRCRRRSSRRARRRRRRSARRGPSSTGWPPCSASTRSVAASCITALLVLWLQRRFDLSIAVAGAVFFWAGVLSAFSALVAVRSRARIGLVRTMVFTHLPANVLLILAPFMPTAPLAVAALLARAALSQMDVPVRTSYVMAVVSPPSGRRRRA